VWCRVLDLHWLSRRPLRLPCLPCLPKGSDIEVLLPKKSTLTSSPIIYVFVLAGSASGRYISTKQIHLTSPHVTNSLFALPNLVGRSCADLRAQQRVCRYTHSLFAPSLHPHWVSAPSRAPDARPISKGVASQAITLFSCSRILNSLQHVRFTRFDSGGLPYNTASPLEAVDPAFLFNETQPILRVALTDNHDFELSWVDGGPVLCW
jgi:hypothetical protein